MLPMLLIIGVLYLLALGAGRMSAAVGIPRVTGYLVVGLAAGPYTGALVGLPPLITQAQLHSLAPVHDIILGLIVFSIGGSFSLRAIRKIGPKLFRISSLEIGICALLVALGTGLAGASALEAAFLAAVSITTAPAATQMVMREYQSEGALTDTILPLIGLNNLMAIIAFILLKHSGLSADFAFWKAMVQVIAPFGLGLFIGLLIALMDQRLTRRVERQIMALGCVALATGLALHFDLSALLAVMIAGMVAVNAAPSGKRILEDLAAIDYPLYVLFFIMAGADLHLEALSHMGLIGVVYVAARSIGKFGGCRLGARAAGTTTTIRIWLGPAMLAQAGLAIGLANILAEEWPGPGKALQTVILASVVVFEMVGPLLTRTALVNAGEVPLLNLLTQRSPVGLSEGLRQVLGHFQKAIGISPAMGRKQPADIRVGHIMRRNMEVLRHKAPFDEVLKALGHSRYDRLPVVNDLDELVGVIKYADIAGTLFDPGLRNLVVADELASGDFLRLTPEDTLKTAMVALREHPQETHLLVVAKDNPRKLVGIVSHNDLLAAHMRQPQ